MKKKKNEKPVFFIPTQNITLIFEPLCSVSDVCPSIENDVFFFTDKRLYDIDFMKDQINYILLLQKTIEDGMKSGKPIFFTTYFPQIAHGIQVVNDVWKMYNYPYEITCFAFFHTDEETKKYCKFPNITDIMELKKLNMDNMEDFPFIKKFNIPYGFKIDKEYLDRLYKEML